MVKHGGWALQTEDAKIWPVLGDRVVGREERQARQSTRGVKYRVVSTARSLVWLEARVLGEGEEF